MRHSPPQLSWPTPSTVAPRPSLTALLGISPPGILERYTTSEILSPLAFAVLRLLLSLYIFASIIVILSTANASAAERFLLYFTNLTYLSFAFYFLFSGVHTLTYALHGVSWLQCWPRVLQVAHVVLYTTMVTLPFLVSITYWTILYHGPWSSSTLYAWKNVSQHGLNSLFALIEIVLPRTPPLPVLHLLFLVIILALYLALTYVAHAALGTYIYFFLNPSKGDVVVYIIGILIATILLFGLVWGMMWVRGWVTEGRAWAGRAKEEEGGYELVNIPDAEDEDMATSTRMHI